MQLVHVITLFISYQHAQAISPVISEASKRYGLDPYLVSAVIKNESQYTPNLCFKGAFGYMQVQTRYRRCTKQAILRAKWRGLYRTRKNIMTGAKLMRLWKDHCEKHHGKYKHHWLLHYNQGFGYCPGKNKKCKAHERIPITWGKIGGYARRVLRYRDMLVSRASHGWSS